MLKRIIGIVIIFCVVVWALGVGGYSISRFKSTVHLRDFGTTMAPVTQWEPVPISTDNSNNSNAYTFDPNATIISNNTNSSTYTFDNNATLNPSDSTSNSDIIVDSDFVSNINSSIDSSNENITTDNINSNNEPNNESSINSDKNNSLNNGIDTSSDTLVIRTFVFTNGNEIKELSSNNTMDFIKWLDTNYNDDISYCVEDTITDISIEDTDTLTDTLNSTKETESNTKESTLNESISTDYLIDSDTLELIESINVISELPKYTDYDRSNFEKPIKSYIYNGKKVNRNDYAWKTSKYFNEKDFTYTCPYTGKVIKDLDDNKQDNDFGILDYDHLVPIKSAYLRGAKDWSAKQQNEYAYDQSVGVDVLNSANRSKSDKGPAEWLPDVNKGSYCYSWIVICQKYKLSMTEEEINICKTEINNAIKNGETIEFMCGYYEN